MLTTWLYQMITDVAKPSFQYIKLYLLFYGRLQGLSLVLLIIWHQRLNTILNFTIRFVPAFYSQLSSSKKNRSPNQSWFFAAFLVRDPSYLQSSIATSNLLLKVLERGRETENGSKVIALRSCTELIFWTSNLAEWNSFPRFRKIKIGLLPDQLV